MISKINHKIKNPSSPTSYEPCESAPISSLIFSCTIFKAIFRTQTLTEMFLKIEFSDAEKHALSESWVTILHHVTPGDLHIKNKKQNSSALKIIWNWRQFVELASILLIL